MKIKNKPLYRMDISSHQLFDVKEMFRIVKTPSGILVIEKDEHVPGRGCYLLRDKNAILNAKKKNMLARGLRCEVNISIYDELLNLL